MGTDRTAALVDRLARFNRLVEVGIGTRTTVAKALTGRGCTVTATDIVDQPAPEQVPFVADDITEPTLSVYADADAIYGLRLPPELQRPTLAVARRVDAAFVFTTLGGDPAIIPAQPEQLPGTTLYHARQDDDVGARSNSNQ